MSLPSCALQDCSPTRYAASRSQKRSGPMELQALGYFGVRARNLDDWTGFATRFLGFEMVEKSNSTLTFRMDDRRQRVVVEADHDNGAAFFGWEGADAAALDRLPATLAPPAAPCA